MHILDNVSWRVVLSFIGNNTLDDISLDFLNIFNIRNKISVSTLFGIGASSVFSAEDINKNLISDQV